MFNEQAIKSRENLSKERIDSQKLINDANDIVIKSYLVVSEMQSKVINNINTALVPLMDMEFKNINCPKGMLGCL